MNKWVSYIKEILISVGKINLFYQNYVSTPNVLKSSIQQTLKDLNIQSWNSKLLESNKDRNYNNIYKHEINFEYYIKAVNRSTYLPILRFRTGNHKFPVEKGRWESIPYHERKCQVCQKKKKGL